MTTPQLPHPAVVTARESIRAALADPARFCPLAGRHHRGLARAGCALPGDNPATGLDQLLGDGHQYKHDSTSTVASACYADQHWVIKRYNHQGVLHGLRRRVSGSRARRSFVDGLLLAELGIATPGPMAYLETSAGLLPRDAYLLCEKSSGETLHELLMRGALSHADWPAIVAKTRELVARLHHFGITHGDIKHTNLLLDGERLDVIDLDSLRIHHNARRFEYYRQKDLAAVEKRIGGDPQAYVDDKKVALGLV